MIQDITEKYIELWRLTGIPEKDITIACQAALALIARGAETEEGFERIDQVLCHWGMYI